jgi:hypothetical protein
MIWGIIKNTAADTFHPVCFRPAPLPSQTTAPLERYKSSGHYTAGFEMIEQAQAEIDRLLTTRPDDRDSGRLYGWDGQGVPALVEFFDGPLSY